MARIKDEYSIDPAQQRLSFNKKMLKGEHTLAHYDIWNKSNLDLVLCLRSGLMRIYLMSPIGKHGTLKVESLDTIKSVKEKIHQVEGIHLNNVILSFAGKPLENDFTLADYSIKDNCTLHYRARLPPCVNCPNYRH
jgi:hypothetical protein